MVQSVKNFSPKFHNFEILVLLKDKAFKNIHWLLVEPALFLNDLAGY